MLNQCILTGNLGADPEVFYSSEGLELRSGSRLSFNRSVPFKTDLHEWFNLKDGSSCLI
jgi:single-stranded DNA-binding protein